MHRCRLVPERAFSGRPPSNGGLNRWSRHRPVQVALGSRTGICRRCRTAPCTRPGFGSASRTDRCSVPIGLSSRSRCPRRTRGARRPPVPPPRCRAALSTSTRRGRPTGTPCDSASARRSGRCRGPTCSSRRTRSTRGTAPSGTPSPRTLGPAAVDGRTAVVERAVVARLVRAGPVGPVPGRCLPAVPVVSLPGRVRSLEEQIRMRPSSRTTNTMWLAAFATSSRINLAM